MRQAHDVREKKVINFLVETSTEINHSLSKDKDRHPLIPPRARLALIFILVDVMGLYWDKYLGLSNTESGYFKNWVNKFCLTTENEEYCKDENLKKINCDDFYKLRNSTLHFYGLPRTSEGIYYALVPDNENIKESRIKSTPKEFLEKLSTSLSVNSRIVQVEVIRKLVWSASINMINLMKENLNLRPIDHIDGIKRIYDEVNDRGVAIINL